MKSLADFKRVMRVGALWSLVIIDDTQKWFNRKPKGLYTCISTNKRFFKFEHKNTKEILTYRWPKAFELETNKDLAIINSQGFVTRKLTLIKDGY